MRKILLKLANWIYLKYGFNALGLSDRVVVSVPVPDGEVVKLQYHTFSKDFISVNLDTKLRDCVNWDLMGLDK